MESNALRGSWVLCVCFEVLHVTLYQTHRPWSLIPRESIMRPNGCTATAYSTNTHAGYILWYCTPFFRGRVYCRYSWAGQFLWKLDLFRKVDDDLNSTTLAVHLTAKNNGLKKRIKPISQTQNTMSMDKTGQRTKRKDINLIYEEEAIQKGDTPSLLRIWHPSRTPLVESGTFE